MRGHLFCEATNLLQKGWPYKTGSTVYTTQIKCPYYKTKGFSSLLKGSRLPKFMYLTMVGTVKVIHKMSPTLFLERTILFQKLKLAQGS